MRCDRLFFREVDTARVFFLFLEYSPRASVLSCPEKAAGLLRKNVLHCESNDISFLFVSIMIRSAVSSKLLKLSAEVLIVAIADTFSNINNCILCFKQQFLCF